MSHRDKLRTPPVSQSYRDNYAKIDWSKKPISKQSDQTKKKNA